MPAKPKAQKTRKKKDGTAEVVKYVRMPAVISAAIAAYQVKNHMTTDAEAIRDLLKRGLQADGLL